MKKVIIAAVALAVIVGGAAALYFRSRPKGTELRILYTSRLRGTLDTFTKEGVEYGGAGRISTLIQRLRTPNTIVVDNGEFHRGAAGESLELGDAITKAMMRAMRAWGVEVANVGYSEQSLGKERALALQKEAGFPLISTSLVDGETGAYVFEPFHVIERGGLRVAFVGLIDDLAIEGARRDREDVLRKDITPEQRKAIEAFRDVGEGFSLLSAEQALVRVRPLLEGKADVVVVLGSGGSELGGALTPYSGKGPFDVVLATTSFPTGQTLKAGEIPVLLNGSHGTHLGLANLFVPKGERARLASWKPVPVTLDITPDARLANLQRDMRKSLGSIDPRLLVVRRPPPGDMSYVGSQACGHCHRREYEIWSAGPHARALESLKKMDAQYDPQCLACHVTAIGAEDGYLSEKDTPKLASVGCEDCHGRGSQHVKLAGHGKEARFLGTGPNVCVRCHDKENSPKYHYRVYWPAIRHGKGQSPEAVGENATMDPMEAELKGIAWTEPKEKAE